MKYWNVYHASVITRLYLMNLLFIKNGRFLFPENAFFAVLPDVSNCEARQNSGIASANAPAGSQTTEFTPTLFLTFTATATVPLNSKPVTLQTGRRLFTARNAISRRCIKGIHKNALLLI